MSEYESWIEEWFFDYHDKVTLLDFLCRQHVLKNMSSDCLNEPMPIESSQPVTLEDGMFFFITNLSSFIYWNIKY